MPFVSFLLGNWKAILIGIAIIALTSYIGFLRLDNIHKEGVIEKQKTENAQLSRVNEILNNEKAAMKEQYDKLQAIHNDAIDIHNLVVDIPKDVKEALKNEKVTRLNDCIVEHARTGVLPEECKDTITGLPVAKTATTN